MLKEINIKKEEKQLFEAYEICLKRVRGKPFYEDFAREKIKHSMQVVGAGNYILKNEKIFQNPDAEYLKLGKLVNLFHDIGRFKEIELLSKAPDSKHDHGFYGYEMLKKLGYDDLRLLLPVKQHGHLTDALNNDTEFQDVKNKRLKSEIEAFYRLVKDADKIANLYLIKHNQRIFNDLFFSGLSETAKFAPISANVQAALEKKTLVKNDDRMSFSDRLIQILCFVFEIYYKSSFAFILKHGLFDNIYEELTKYCQDKKQAAFIKEYISEYILKRYNEM